MDFSRFELLPNEILIEISDYLDARDIYYAFYGLNLRLNALLQSLDRLYIYIHYNGRSRIRHDHLFALRVHTLIIDRNRLLDNLHQFPNIRHVIFIKSFQKKIEHVINQLNNLEHLTVKVKGQGGASRSIYQRIFTNDFPCLKSFIHKASHPPSLTNTWTQTPSIHFLDVTSDFSRIHMFLAACPNLHFLKITIPKLAGTLADLKQYEKLQRLHLTITTDQLSFDELPFDSLFACLPNLEYLYLQQSIMNINMINNLKQSQWLANVLARHLLSLRQFKLTLCLSANQHFDIQQLKTNFSKAHDQRYEHELKII
ncbi:unnamed protein product [Adineta steineri]|uniref:F-box domain-containing protein n=1 Tax=Adineta steineri TaxID=433720 RepID=A0A815YXX7_9BILA|nr:unnamed protein product [Adineta steineri]CAF1576691.1 unnamed protein product [Adineta steineri]